jgi:hypothetical protein
MVMSIDPRSAEALGGKRTLAGARETAYHERVHGEERA